MAGIPTKVELDVHSEPGPGTNEWLIEKVKQWQTCGITHPLTCGGSECRSVLEADEIEDEVVLICPDCGYVQNWIPNVVFQANLKF